MSEAIPERVLRIWRTRERVEREAADLFNRLATDLAEVFGESDALTQQARKSGRDETVHSSLCQDILNTSQKPVELLPAVLGAPLGPVAASLRERVVYTAVAMGCVTETLSCALLVEMQKRAGPQIIKHTVQEILEDEISHGRLGWSVLTREKSEHNVSWLKPYLAGMVREAMHSDVLPMTVGDGETTCDLSEWGILPQAEATAIMTETVNKVIYPGLRALGVFA